MRTRSALRWLTLISAAIVIVAVPHAISFARLSQLSLTENRLLASAPKLPGNVAELNAYPQKLDDFIRDNFPLRSNIIASINYARYLAGYSMTKHILVGREGWLFWDNGTHLAHGLGISRLDQASLDRWLNGFKQNVDYANSRNIGYYVLPAPQQESIYPEKAPLWLARKARPTSEIDQIVNAAIARGFDNVVDVRGELIAAKPSLEVYRPYDTHWTGDGVYIAYRALMGRISRDYPDLAPLPQSNFTPAPQSHIPKGLSGLIGITDFVKHSGKVYATSPAHDERLVTYLSERRDWASAQIWETNPSASRTLLLMRDSFGTELLPLLKPHFRRIVIVHVDNGFFRKDLMERFQPDIAIVEVIENGLRYVGG